MRRVPLIVRLVVMAGILLAAAAVRAGAAEPTAVLHLSNGDRLSGRQVAIEGGRLRWRLADGPEIAIPLSTVKRIERDDATHIEPAGWTTRIGEDSQSQSENGTIVNIDDEIGDEANESGDGDSDSGVAQAGMFQQSSTFAEPIAPNPAFGPGDGRLVPHSSIPRNPAFRPSEDPDAIDETDSYFASAWNAIRVRSAETFEGFTNWTEHLEAGGRTLSGNTQEDYITVGAKFSKTTAEQTALIELGGQWSQAQGRRQSNRWWGNGTVDYNKKGNWLFFMTTKNEYDEFENLLWRGTLAAGPGYRIINEPERRFIVRVGPAVTREIFTDPKNDRATADLFGEFEIVTPMLWDRLLWEHKTTAIPSVEDFSLIRITTASDLSLRIDDEARWHVKLGFRHEYNSKPNPGRERADLTTSLFLVYKRK